MPPVQEILWYSRSKDLILADFKTTVRGLTSAEAHKRLRIHGANRLPEAKQESRSVIFARQFASPLIYVLLLAAVVMFFMGEFSDAFIIFVVLLINAIVGAIQEGRAQNILAALKSFSETNAAVLRDGREVIISDSELVPGDVVILQEGEKVPADIRIVESSSLRTDESAITGESIPVFKTSDEITTSVAAVGDQRNMAWKGTHVVGGYGKGVVIYTGTNTTIGRISSEITQIDTEIPLKADIRILSRVIIIVMLSLSAVLFFTGIAMGRPLREMFGTMVALAVSIIPEGLPIALTLILATGVWRMAKRHALVKRLQAVEALGQARVIAVDKTGTLTKNELVVRTIMVGDEVFFVSGVGYSPKGDVTQGGALPQRNSSALARMGRIAALSSNARVVFDEAARRFRVSGDPTEAALTVLGEKMGIVHDEIRTAWSEFIEKPFDYVTKLRITICRSNQDEFIAVTGAPEAILALATYSEDGNDRLTEKRRKDIEARMLGMSENGMRVVAAAYFEGVHPKSTSEFYSRLRSENSRAHEGRRRHAEEGIRLDLLPPLTFAGFFGMEDSLRPEAVQAVEVAHRAGIRVVMITGDHEATAKAIARQAGIFVEGDQILRGLDVDTMSDEELAAGLTNVTVFVRVTPEHKLRIINAYKKRGEIIAMTGDGVNDAPSLVAADLGVAMGTIGTEVAKEASDIVLLDDNFGSIVAAIEEGRSIYATIKKTLTYLFSTSLGEFLVIAAAIVLGYPIPLLPGQIVWLNLVTDGFLTVALAMEPKERGLLHGVWRKPGKYLVDGTMLVRMVLMGVVMMIGTLVLFHGVYEADYNRAITIALTVLAVFQWLNAWNCRSTDKSLLHMNPFSNPSLILATLAIIGLHVAALYTPFMQKVLHTVPLSLWEWGIIIVISSSILVVEEFRKVLTARMRRI